MAQLAAWVTAGQLRVARVETFAFDGRGTRRVRRPVRREDRARYLRNVSCAGLNLLRRVHLEVAMPGMEDRLETALGRAAS